MVRVYPVPGEPGRHVSRISMYHRAGVESAYGRSADDERTRAEAFAAIIRDEDYVASASQQQSAESGALESSLFGRKEPALHHYHSTYRACLGMEPRPLLSEAEATAPWERTPTQPLRHGSRSVEPLLG